MLEETLVDEFAEDGNSAEDGMGHGFVLQVEDLVGGAGEDAGEDEGQLQAGHVAVALDGVDALAGDAGGLGQLLLRPAAGGAEFLDAVCDGGLSCKADFPNQSSREDLNVKPAFHFS